MRSACRPHYVSAMADSYEFAAFRCCFSSLQEGVKHDLGELVTKLFAKSLVSSANRDQSLSRTDQPGERAAHLLTVLESRIHGDPASFHSVLQELDSCPTLKFLATKLRSELERVKREGEPQHGSQTEAASTEEVDGGPSPTTGSQSADVQSTALHSNTEPAEETRQEPLRGEQGEGGYKCEFIEPPSKVLQTECSVCHLILQEPTIVSCCGYSFCQTCIEQVQASSKTCPLCGASGFSFIPNKSLQRMLNEYQVWCVKKEVGCEWTGELGKLSEHLNITPKPAPKWRLEGCAFIEMECSMCHELFQRQTIVKHENDQCPQRPYSCDYCKEYRASFRDVVNKHYPVCKHYPLPCPNKCDELPEGSKYMIERQNLEHHVKEECPLTVVECDFHYAGCGVKLPCKDMAGHLAENLVAHVSLLAVHGKKTAADAQKALEERDKEIARLREDTKRRDEEIVQIQETARKQLEERDRQVAQMRENINKLERDNKALKERTDSNFDRLHSHLHTPPVTFTMSNFEQHKRNKDTWYSPPFYTHPHGYKMCVNIIWKDNGFTVGPNLMRGEFDHCLQWPFQCDVYIRLLNQFTDDNHITITGNFSCGPTFGNIGMRVTVGEQQEHGRGDYIPYATLNCHGDYTENCQYLRDNCIQLQVARVVDTVQLQREIVATVNHRSLRTPPCQFIMRDFEQLKKDGDIWYSPSFFTHSKGYRMCLGVYANGYDEGRGTHVSVFTHLMYGEFDSHLKWPFRGVITIQLRNQLEDKRHHTKTINYTDVSTVRVIVGEKDFGRGFTKFIPHSELGLNQSRNCQYFRDDCLIFKIDLKDT